MVVGNHDSGMLIVAPRNHVASGLAAEDKTSMLEGGANRPAGQAGRKLRLKCCVRLARLYRKIARSYRLPWMWKIASLRKIS
jgi:hypothetical protein